MIDDHPTGCPFGRTAISLIFSTFLAEKLGYDFRIISNGGSVNKQYVGDILRTNSISWTHNIDFLSIGPDDPRAEIPVGAGDVFLTTSWDIAAYLLNGIDATKVIYLLLEDERIRLLESKQSNQCQEILKNEKIKFVVNTKRLYDHFGSTGLENICKSGAWFEPAWQETLFFPDEGRPDGRKNFLYTLPADAGDEFCKLTESALDGAIQKGIFNQDEWNFFGVSKTAFKTRNSHPFLLKRYQDMDCLRYLSLVRKTDLCLAMTGKPFLLPDFHPFDHLACGAVVVSNYSDESPDMIPHLGNLIHSNVQVDEIIQCLARGVELVNQADLRLSNFRMNVLHKDWRTSFEGILSSIESWDFNVPA
jgi:hypothetical protein